MQTSSVSNKLLNLHFILRLVIVAVLGAAPNIGMITLAYRLSTNVSALEQALVFNLMNAVVTSLAVAWLPKHYRMVFAMSLVICAYAGYVWVAANGFHAGMLFFMCCAQVVYLLRIRFVINTEKEPTDSLRTQFKGDTIALSSLAAYYIVFDAVFNAGNRHYPEMKYFVISTAVLAILVWAYTLRSAQHAEAGTTGLPAKSMWTTFGIAVGLLVIAIPAAATILTVAVTLGSAALLIPASKLVPRFHIGGRTQDYTPLPVNPGKPRQDTHYLFTPHDARITILVVLATAVVCIIWMLLHRTKHRHAAGAQLDIIGSLQITNRARDQDHAELQFLKTDDPIRNHIQAWLRSRIKSNQSIELWQTIRDIERNSGAGNGLENVVSQYETVRYDPR